MDKIHVLIADDDAMVRKLLSSLICSLECSYDECINGMEAIEKLNSTRYDLVFMDVMMPVLDGITSCREYRSKEQRSDEPLPIIGITGGGEEDVQECRDAGMTDIITKPFSRLEIENKLKTYTRYHH